MGDYISDGSDISAISDHEDIPSPRVGNGASPLTFSEHPAESLRREKNDDRLARPFSSLTPGADLRPKRSKHTSEENNDSLNFSTGDLSFTESPKPTRAAISMDYSTDQYRCVGIPRAEGGENVKSPEARISSDLESAQSPAAGIGEVVNAVGQSMLKELLSGVEEHRKDLDEWNGQTPVLPVPEGSSSPTGAAESGTKVCFFFFFFFFFFFAVKSLLKLGSHRSVWVTREIYPILD